jgi:hypothetical protein
MDWRTAFTEILDLAVLAGAAFYAVYVLIRYLTNGPGPRPQVDLRDPARSAEHLAVWLGVKTVALGVRMGTPIFAMLSEASADVGDWFLSNLHHESR